MSITNARNQPTFYTYDLLGHVRPATVTTYTLDLAAGLTQILSDGTYTYTYGLGRITQKTALTSTYFLADALGSVRQLADSAGRVTLRRSYDPYGNGLTSSGLGASSYGFTGEWVPAAWITQGWCTCGQGIMRTFSDRLSMRFAL